VLAGDGEAGVAKKAVDGFVLAEGLEDGVLLEEVEALGLGLEVVGKRAVGDGVVALEGSAGGAEELGHQGGQRIRSDARRCRVIPCCLLVMRTAFIVADGAEEDASAVLRLRPLYNAALYVEREGSHW
jgi:hypothetical protein